jgi:hypothetical protein
MSSQSSLAWVVWLQVAALGLGTGFMFVSPEVSLLALCPLAGLLGLVMGGKGLARCLRERKGALGCVLAFAGVLAGALVFWLGTMLTMFGYVRPLMEEGTADLFPGLWGAQLALLFTGSLAYYRLGPFRSP